MTTEDVYAVKSDKDDTGTTSETPPVAEQEGVAVTTNAAAPQGEQTTPLDQDGAHPASNVEQTAGTVTSPIATPDEAATSPAESVSIENTTPAASDAPATPKCAADDTTRPSAGTGQRIRERLTSQPDEKAVGSSDDGLPRQEFSQGGLPVEIPFEDELDASLEAQISEAMTSDESAPVETAPVAGIEAEEGESGAPVEELGPGSQLKGTVQQIHGDDVFIEAGVRSGVVVPLRQFAENKQPSVGDELTVIIDSVDADGLFRARIPQGRHKTGGNWDTLAVGQVVDCMVTDTNKGGLQVTVSSLKGFMPASQIDLGYVADLQVYVGQKLTAQITEVNKKKRNLVLSRRFLLQTERESQQGDFWTSLEVGQDHEGVVKTIKDYGVFINLGPMDGFLHIGEIAWSRISHPNEVVTEGQTVQVRILRLDAERQRISLGMKQLLKNPWLTAVERYVPEQVVPGKVTRLTDFGAFVELEPGIEGLVHISELAWRRVGSVSEVLSLDESRDFQVIEVDPKRKRISLSVKALENQPENREAEDVNPAPNRKSNPDLRGGTSEEKGGSSLFGNPSDFT